MGWYLILNCEFVNDLVMRGLLSQREINGMALTVEQITNLYLYGKDGRPDDLN